MVAPARAARRGSGPAPEPPTQRSMASSAWWPIAVSPPRSRPLRQTYCHEPITGKGWQQHGGRRGTPTLTPRAAPPPPPRGPPRQVAVRSGRGWRRGRPGDGAAGVGDV